MGKSYKAWSPTESYLVPPAPQDWLPEGHLAYFVLEFAQEADLGAIEESGPRPAASATDAGSNPEPPGTEAAKLRR